MAQETVNKEQNVGLQGKGESSPETNAPQTKAEKLQGFQHSLNEAKKTEQERIAALSRAQRAFDEAVKTGDSAKILEAANVLNAAQTGVGQSKNAISKYENAIKDLDREERLEAVRNAGKQVSAGTKGLFTRELRELLQKFEINAGGVMFSGLGTPEEMFEFRYTGQRAARAAGAPRGPRQTSGINWSQLAQDNGIDPEALKGNSAHRIVMSKLPDIHASTPHDCIYAK